MQKISKILWVYHLLSIRKKPKQGDTSEKSSNFLKQQSQSFYWFIKLQKSFYIQDFLFTNNNRAFNFKYLAIYMRQIEVIDPISQINRKIKLILKKKKVRNIIAYCFSQIVKNVKRQNNFI